MRHILMPLTVSVLLTLSGNAYSQNYLLMLTEEQEATLPEDAHEVYQEAKYQDDHVNYDESVKLIAKAAELAPENIDLQFLAAVRSRDRAEIYYSQSSFSQPPEGMEEYTSPPWCTAEPFIELTQAAAQRLMVNPNLSDIQRSRLETELDLFEKRMSALSERDFNRLETALSFVVKIRNARQEAMEKNQEPLDPLDPRNALEADQPTEDDLIDSLVPTEEMALVDPFAELPGEYIAPFIPPAPPPQQQGNRNNNAFGGAMGGPSPVNDPFGAGGEGMPPMI